MRDAVAVAGFCGIQVVECLVPSRIQSVNWVLGDSKDKWVLPRNHRQKHPSVYTCSSHACSLQKCCGRHASKPRLQSAAAQSGIWRVTRGTGRLLQTKGSEGFGCGGRRVVFNTSHTVCARLVGREECWHTILSCARWQKREEAIPSSEWRKICFFFLVLKLPPCFLPSILLSFHFTCQSTYRTSRFQTLDEHNLIWPESMYLMVKGRE